MDVDDLDPDPHVQFERWFAEASAAGVPYPEQMALATAAADGAPSVRMVLLKGHDPRGFVFYTNRESRKAVELEANPRAAIVLHWELQDRQVRVEGTVVRVDDDESFAYFRTRPRGSRLGAWASPQSRPLASRDELLRRYAEVERRFAGEEEVPLPPFWGGYRIVPDTIEFWQGQQSRLHDRVLYTRAADGGWQRRRLGP
ncbi:pdxH: pyridoxamine 5'-phosphate oxidase [Gaiella occulta]|uniref:Pyridoxine/pyridoxamine 5'-phosphate oxidase n=1 Tax=Gaiella occulta TaxID=1002870 RepID=A0A7M2Z0G4_9ACTN|nr:pyridoxamine 5'-phosphate oxidase [Gaiella occulta]RDI75609.1 pdxH: pyridoxamine 5'-phosphate oxidase [Gaiella occulta]